MPNFCAILHTVQENDMEPITHSVAHYLLTIHRLKEVKGYARVTDVAKELNITKGSVSTAMNALKKKELIKEEEGAKFILLTKKGHDKVHHVLSSRTLLYYFLKDILGVKKNDAYTESCEMEHLLSYTTQKKLFDFMALMSHDDQKEKLQKMISKVTMKLELEKYKSFDDFVSEQEATLPFEE